MDWNALGAGWNPFGWESQWLLQTTLNSIGRCISAGLTLPDILGVSIIFVRSLGETQLHVYPWALRSRLA
ncbi:hypothetical protein F4678DRAFT_450627 [Xylaria arbuscula]|nr:hypothetical protein F4678DRAFT_450627 [Xylaria arbuscula]